MFHNLPLCSAVLSVFLLFCHFVNRKLNKGLLLTFALLLSASAAQAQNNAAFVSESHAATMTTGQVSTVSVTMRNTGATTWTAGASYRLGSQNPQDNTVWGTGRAELGTAVAPGQQYTFTFNVTAPATAGSYNFQWRMLREGVEWFGTASTNATVSVTNPPPLNAASFVSQSVSASALGGQVKTVSVTMLNTGNTTWTSASGYGLGSQNAENNMTWGLNRVATGTSVAPGQQYTFTFNITAPASAGTYNFQWRMLKEYVEWFGPYTPNVPVSVTVPTNNAAFVAQSVPASVASNTAFNVTVTMKNNGSTTWAAGSYFLRAQNPDGTYRWGLNQINLPSNVAPGQQVTFSFQSLSPSTAGVYNYQWQMQQAGVGNFGAMSTNVAINVTAPVANAAFVSQTVAASMTAGQQSSASVTMLNSGNVTWTAGLQFKLSAINPVGNATWGTSSVTVPSTVAPGSQVTFQIPVTAPATAGTYHFQWQMYSGTAFGAATTNVPVTVSAAAATVTTLNAPVNGASATVGTALTMTATPSGNVGPVASVKFFANGVQVGTGAYAGGAWNSTWTPTVAGTFSVIASSYNASNTLLSSSAAASVTVSSAGSGGTPATLEAVTITPPHLGNPDAGTLPGNLSVSPTGAAAYSIDLVVPPGTAGMQPALSLAYSSAAGNGVAGLGWALSGAASIQRCSKTIAQDGVFDRISFSNSDRLCIDGNRLVRMDGANPGADMAAQDAAYWAAGAIYRTEQETFARITRLANGGFKVELKSGAIDYYGTDANSASQAHGRSDGKPMQWMLARSEDRKGNYLTWTYNIGASGEVTPALIRYGGNSVANQAADLAVRFGYEARPDAQNNFVGGSRHDQTLRLLTVTTVVGTDTAGNGGTMARTYQLQYRQSIASGRSLVSSVQVSATNPNTGAVELLPKTSFDWADTVATPASVKGEPFAWPNFGISTDVIKYREPQQVLAKLDGSGRHSMVSVHLMACGMWNEGNCRDPDFGILHVTGRLGIRSPDGVLSETMVDFSPLRDVALGPLQMGLARKTPSYVQFGDINGDGRDDILAVDFSGSDWSGNRTVWGVCLNDGTTTLHFTCIPGAATEPVMAELRSDRKMHMVSFDGVSSQGTDCYYSSASGKIECKAMSVTMESPLPNDLGRLNMRPKFFQPRGTSLGKNTTDFYALWQAEVPAAVPSDPYRIQWYYNSTTGTAVDTPIDIIQGVTACIYSATGLACKTLDQIRSAGKMMSIMSSPESIGDLNGDGLTDFMYVVRAPKPLPPGPFAPEMQTKAGQDYHMGIQVPSAIRVCLSKETSVECSTQSKTFAPNLDYTDPAATAQIDDFTADGITRVLFDVLPNAPSLTGARSELCQLTPAGFVCQNIAYVPVSSKDADILPASARDERYHGGPAILSDSGVSTHFVKSPTKIDSMQAWTPWRIEAAPGQDKLARVIDGIGNTVEVSYARGDDASVHARYATIDGVQQLPVYPNILAPAGVLVKQSRRSNGKGAMRKSDFYYEGAMSDAEGRNPSGFGKFRETEFESQIAMTGIYRRDYPFAGEMLRKTTTSRNGVVLSDENIAMNKQEFPFASGGKSTFTFVSGVNTTRKDLDGSAINSTGTVNRYEDGWGNLTSSTETTTGAGKVFSKDDVSVYKNDQANWLLGLPETVTTKKTDPAAGAITRTMHYEYDANGAVSREVVEKGTALQVDVTHERTINKFGLIDKSVQKWTDPYTGALVSRNLKDVDYDAKGRFILTSRNARGHAETSAYYAATGVRRSLRDANQLSTTWTADGFGRIQLELGPDGSETRSYVKSCTGSCPANGAVATIVDRFNAGKRTVTPTVVYTDIAGHKVRTLQWGFNGKEIYTDTRYDDLGRPDEIDHPRFFDAPAIMAQKRIYDDLNRVTEQQGRDTGGAIVRARSVFNGLDVTRFNELDKPTTESRDALGRVVKVRDPIGGETVTTYDAFGNALSIKDPNGNVIVLAYDRLGRKTDMNDPDLGLVHSDLDPLGRAWKETTPKQRAAGQFTRMEYDALDRVTGRYETDLESHWVFDTAAQGTGRLAEAYTKTGALKDYQRLHLYDALGRSAATTELVGGTQFKRTPEYDGWGRLSRESHQRGAGATKIFDWRYNDKGYLAHIERGSLKLWQLVAQDAFHRPTEVLFGNGLVQKSAFEPYTARLDNSDVRLAGALRLADSYKYNKTGNVSQRDQSWDVGGFSESFGYDDLGRLSSSTVSGYAAKGYAYDGAGNIKSKTGTGAGDYVYPPQGLGAVRPHSVQSIPGVGAFTYDVNGNMESGAGRIITWTSFNMPKRMDRSGAWSTFLYGPEHQRTVQERSGGTVTAYAGAMEAEQNGAQWTVKTYWPNGIGVEIEKSDGTVELNWTHKDRLGSPVAISGSNGALKERLAYDAWGKRRTTDGSSTPDTLDGVTDNKGYTGHEMLDHLDLVHMNGRVYDPLIGRFVSADPRITDPSDGQNYNRYSYVVNNPLGASDPTGFDAQAVAPPMQQVHVVGPGNGAPTVAVSASLTGGGGGFMIVREGNNGTTGRGVPRGPSDKQQAKTHRFGIGIRAPKKQARNLIGDSYNPNEDPGHTIAYLKDGGGVITDMLSYGPAVILGIHNMVTFAAGDVKGDSYHEIGDSKFTTWEFPITVQQYRNAQFAFTDFRRTNPNYTPEMNCTSAALLMAASIGVPLPDGRGTARSSLVWVNNMPNPYHLFKALYGNYKHEPYVKAAREFPILRAPSAK